jgi:ParB family chromosome partitioning protein
MTKAAPMSEINEIERKAAKKPALGRGLGSLLSGNGPEPESRPQTITTKSHQTSQVPDTERVWKISIDKLTPRSDQPRRVFDKAPLEELAQSIRVQGILQPIVARKRGAQDFEIIAGERRWRAAQLAGLHEVPVLLQDVGDQKALELALIENIQRQDLNPMEEAMAYSHLIEDYSLTQQQLAEKIGKDRVTIANTLRLLQLTHDVRAMVSAREISLGQAKILLMIQDPLDQKKMALQIVREKLSVRACERLVHKYQAAKTQSPKDTVEQTSVKAVSEELQKLMGSKVTIDYNDGKGRISIHFYSDDELTEFTQKVRTCWQTSKP